MVVTGAGHINTPSQTLVSGVSTKKGFLGIGVNRRDLCQNAHMGDFFGGLVSDIYLAHALVMVYGVVLEFLCRTDS